MKLIDKILEKSIGFISLFLLFFIPLYPKLPLIDIKNTWVYIRVEDFLVLTTIFIWLYLLARKKVSLKTPITIPILAFWILGAIATIHGVVIIFPTIASVFPNVALLSFVRHIEYFSLFFVAYSSVKDKKFVIYSTITLIITLILVILYGFGQKYLGFPAYLTMNEEYAKGIPITISPLNRVSSTFAGHYDLAAYLVFVIPIAASLFFGVKNIFLKIGLVITTLMGLALLALTVSRVSIVAVGISLLLVVFFSKKKLLLILIPIIILGGIFLSTKQSTILERLNSTVRETNILVDTKSGADVGQVEFQDRSFLQGKTILEEEKGEVSSDSAGQIVVYEPDVPRSLAKYRIGQELGVVQAKITSTGESLPQGSSYINLSLAPVTKRINHFFYEYPPDESTNAAQIRIVTGDFLVKRASAYDLSFTTRFQGEWPHAMEAFARNLLFGSGYGSVSLAVDNNYFRMLGEIGLLGTFAFIAIFIVIGAYIKKVLPSVDSPFVRALVFGYIGGTVGLFLNATLIDVFEASKVAFTLWLVTGFVVGGLSLYGKNQFNTYRELGKVLVTPIAFIIYLLIATIAIFSTTLSGYFIGDDFTWFRWAADCKEVYCQSKLSTILHYFTNSDGFFYRPGTKTYFLLMYPLFWLNQVVYHLVSIVLHFIVVVLLYILARKIFRNNLTAAISSFIFLILSGYLETVLWISATGHIVSAIFVILSLLTFIKWDESKKKYYLAISLVFTFVSLLFYETGIIAPLLAISYAVSKGEISMSGIFQSLKNKIFILLFIPNIIYALMRFISNSHWFGGDYSYNLIKFPVNSIGNALGYFMLSLFGPLSLTFYEKLREATRSNILISVILAIGILIATYFVGKWLFKKLDQNTKRIVVFSLLFFAICLIPYFGLGNITYRYSYLASFGVCMLIALIFTALYKYLKVYGRDVAVFSVILVFLSFTLLHIIQAQQAMLDWRGAGDKVKGSITSLDALYHDSWSKRNIDLYFVKVPTKHGIAWVYPVGLSDAIWFAFKNDNITIHQVNDLSEVPSSTFNSKTAWVFEFQPDGSLKELRPNIDTK